MTPTQSGDFILGVRCQGFARLTVEGKQVAVAFGGGGGSSAGVDPSTWRRATRSPSTSATQHKRHAHAELIWAKVNNAPSPEAIAAAKNVDAVIAVVGITSQR